MQIALDRDLAGETLVQRDLALGQMGGLRGKHRAAAFEHLDPALAAGAFAAARRRHEQLCV